MDQINQENSSQKVYFKNILHCITTRHMNRGDYFSGFSIFISLEINTCKGQRVTLEEFMFYATTS